jgi:predicted negative regulator of RcsB-dependent stress response
VKTKAGFSLVEGLVITGVLVLVVGLGYFGWKSFTKSTNETITPVSSSATVEVITTEKDLDRAIKELDELKFEDENSAQAEPQAALE